jgi:hypothetical protein
VNLDRCGMGVGYAVESSHHAAVDRVLITGDAPKLAQEEKMFAHLAPHTCDLTLYISDRRELVTEKAIPGVEIGVSTNGIAAREAAFWVVLEWNRR